MMRLAILALVGAGAIVLPQEAGAWAHAGRFGVASGGGGSWHADGWRGGSASGGDGSWHATGAAGGTGSGGDGSWHANSAWGGSASGGGGGAPTTPPIIRR